MEPNIYCYSLFKFTISDSNEDYINVSFLMASTEFVLIQRWNQQLHIISIGLYLKFKVGYMAIMKWWKREV